MMFLNTRYSGIKVHFEEYKRTCSDGELATSTVPYCTVETRHSATRTRTRTNNL